MRKRGPEVGVVEWATVEMAGEPLARNRLSATWK